ncbi:phosphatase PAP2 family protein [Pseudomonas sp. RIT-PI-AD]|uniref:phosphatase PAP2 family protein n=1 Tax=Pseudomonas sp. RIT-PI-AD TaxID=3035294 RepID=UPI0021D80D8D|nr:phosphatase PAP2 family protein [Pseudomonas sp. RIT-PI-AD]
MDKAHLFQAEWRWTRFLLCHAIALVLLGLWLFEPVRAAFFGFDTRLFHLLNAPLADNALWRHVWAVASLRPFDILVGLILLSLLIRGDWLYPAVQARAATFGFIATLILLLVIRVLFSKLAKHLGWQHASPSEQLDGAVHLSDFFPEWERRYELKDRSGSSFPGDHASVLMIWALFLGCFVRTAWQGLVIGGLALLFMFPRLVAGAHWASDDYIGGLAMALPALAWSMYTPFAAWASERLMRLTAPVFRALARVPLLNRLSVVRLP